MTSISVSLLTLKTIINLTIHPAAKCWFSFNDQASVSVSKQSSFCFNQLAIKLLFPFTVKFGFWSTAELALKFVFKFGVSQKSSFSVTEMCVSVSSLAVVSSSSQLLSHSASNLLCLSAAKLLCELAVEMLCYSTVRVLCQSTVKRPPWSESPTWKMEPVCASPSYCMSPACHPAIQPSCQPVLILPPIRAECRAVLYSYSRQYTIFMAARRAHWSVSLVFNHEHSLSLFPLPLSLS